jgi:Tol biopolymer transport system component
LNPLPEEDWIMNRRVVANDLIRMLLLSTLLLCGTTATPRESINSSHQKISTPVVTAASVPAAQVYGDGLIAYSADEQIYIMHADGSGVTLLISGTLGVLNRYPALSPDGRRLAFTRDDERRNQHTLYIIGIDGSNLQRLTESPVALGEPSWSPDGSQIAFVRGYDTTYGGYANVTSCGQEIYVIDVATGKQENLTKGEGGTDPTWSPDGTRIAFTSARDGDFEIYTMASDGKEVKQLTDTSWAEAEPAWSPDGKLIAYTAHLHEGAFLCGFMPTVRPSGTNPEGMGVYVMNSDGTDQTPLARTTGGLEPTWSPDSTRLALVINGKGGWQLYVTDAGGMSLTRLTEDATQKTSPSWSLSSETVR